MFRLILSFTSLFIAAASLRAASALYQRAVKARIENNQVVVQFENGSRSMVPLSSLHDEDRAHLIALAEKNPLPRGKSSVVVAKATVPTEVKRTIVTAKTEGSIETVQLCPPNVFRDQIGSTCMLYGRIHWLDIAGYGMNAGSIYQILNRFDPDEPFRNGGYHEALAKMITSFTPKPIVHPLPGHATDQLEWAREQLRLGRPLLAALPKEIWQALPPTYVAHRRWEGGVGHQIVINGFTWDREARKGTFHIINSWHELSEFDLTTENATPDVLVIECSLSPRGEMPSESAKEVIKAVRLIRSMGATQLYEVETNLGKRRVAASSEEAARASVQADN